MTDDYKKTLCDIDIIINNLNEEEKKMVPAKLRKLIRENKLENYQSNVQIDIPLEQQQLNANTQSFLAMLYLNYWCQDEEEKRRIKVALSDNEEKYQKELSEKYDVYAIFKSRQEKNKINIEETTQEIQMTTYKESIIKKILNKIFNLFRRK